MSINRKYVIISVLGYTTHFSRSFYTSTSIKKMGRSGLWQHPLVRQRLLIKYLINNEMNVNGYRLFQRDTEAQQDKKKGGTLKYLTTSSHKMRNWWMKSRYLPITLPALKWCVQEPTLCKSEKHSKLLEAKCQTEKTFKEESHYSKLLPHCPIPAQMLCVQCDSLTRSLVWLS